MSYHQGFLYMANAYGNAVELVNEARTAYNLTTASFAGTPRFSDILLNAGCESLNYVPCTMAADGSVTSWQTLATGLTNTPWYVASSTASIEAFGFYIEEWTGLDSGTWTREQAGRGDRKGSTWGFQSMPGRVMAINVTLCGSSDRGLNHLFRWLENRLAFMCRDPLRLPSIWLREFCPQASIPSANIVEGLARLDGVALLAGLSWIDPPVEKAGCFLRRASFTIGAQDPCFYREGVTVGTAALAGTPPAIPFGVGTTRPAPFGTYNGSALQLAVSMPKPSYGMVAPKVTIISPATIASSGLRILGFANPQNLALTETGRMYPVGALVLNGTPNGVDLIVDLAAGTILTRSTRGSLDWVDGSLYIDRTDYTPFGFAAGTRWFSFDDCTAGVVVVEPAWYGLDFGTVTIDAVTKFGCPT